MFFQCHNCFDSYIIVHIVSSENSMQAAYYYLLRHNINDSNISDKRQTTKHQIRGNKFVRASSQSLCILCLKSPISIFKTYLLVTLLHPLACQLLVGGLRPPNIPTVLLTLIFRSIFGRGQDYQV